MINSKSTINSSQAPCHFSGKMGNHQFWWKLQKNTQGNVYLYEENEGRLPWTPLLLINLPYLIINQDLPRPKYHQVLKKTGWIIPILENAEKMRSKKTPFFWARMWRGWEKLPDKLLPYYDESQIDNKLVPGPLSFFGKNGKPSILRKIAKKISKEMSLYTRKMKGGCHDPHITD